MKRLHGLSGLAMTAALIGCGGGDAAKTDDSGIMPGFQVPALQAGYTRFVAPIIKDIKPGADVMYCQWIAAPADKDLTIKGFASAQSSHGHHVVLYANTLNEAVGTSRLCTNDDMLSVRYAGASAGEGGSLKFKLPEGVVYQIPKGTALMLNTHFINPTGAAFDGQAVVDLQLADTTPDEKVAGMFTNLTTSFSVPANSQGVADTSCVAQKDMDFLSFSNHLHEWGTSGFSEIIRQDGSKVMLSRDATWSAEKVFDPSFAAWTVDAPMAVKKGDTIHTHCEWNNTTSGALEFPQEMCVGFAFYLPGGEEINCSDGEWPNP